MTNPDLNKKLIRTENIRGEEVKVYLVNGTFVRDNLMIDWTMGGHFYVSDSYHFIPKGEIYIDQDMEPKDIEATIIHEVAEYEKMKYEGWDYEKAHEYASSVELEFRNNPKNNYNNTIEAQKYIRANYGNDSINLLKVYLEHGGEDFINYKRLIKTTENIINLGEKNKLIAFSEALIYEQGYLDNFNDLRSSISKGGLELNKKSIQRMIESGVDLPNDIINLINKQPMPTIKEQVEARLIEKEKGRKIKDVGRVASSAKERAAYRIITMDNIDEINQDEIVAFNLVKKDAIWEPINIDEQKEAGVSAGACFIKVKIRESLPSKPANNANKRKTYVHFLNIMQTDLMPLKTVNEVKYAVDKYLNLSVSDAAGYFIDSKFSSYSEEKQKEMQSKFTSAYKYVSGSYFAKKLIDEIFGKTFLNMINRGSDSAYNNWKLAEKYEASEGEEESYISKRKQSYSEAVIQKEKDLEKYINSDVEGKYAIITRNYRNTPSLKIFKSDDPFKGEKHYSSIYIAYLNKEIQRFKAPIEVPLLFKKRENDWSWSIKETKEGEVKERSKTINTKEPLSYIKRINGYKTPDPSPENVVKYYGFSAYNFGKYVPDNERAEHAKHFIGAITDLAEILDIDIKQVHEIVGLGFGVGLKGHAGHLAAYYSQTKDINLVRGKGDGSVAHEWGHFFDNMLSDFGDKKAMPMFGSEGYAKDPLIQNLFSEFKNICLKGIPDVSYKPKTFYSVNITTDRVQILDTIEQSIDKFFKDLPSVSYFTVDKYWEEHRTKFLGYIIGKHGLSEYQVSLKLKTSMFYADSMMMGNSKYWVSLVEMFARSFETHIFNKLANAGMGNNYLAHDAYLENHMPYPRGKEYEAIGIVIDKIVDRFKEVYNIRPFSPIINERIGEEIIELVKKEDSVIPKIDVVIEKNENMESLEPTGKKEAEEHAETFEKIKSGEIKTAEDLGQSIEQDHSFKKIREVAENIILKAKTDNMDSLALQFVTEIGKIKDVPKEVADYFYAKYGESGKVGTKQASKNYLYMVKNELNSKEKPSFDEWFSKIRFYKSGKVDSYVLPNGIKGIGRKDNIEWFKKQYDKVLGVPKEEKKVEITHNFKHEHILTIIAEIPDFPKYIFDAETGIFTFDSEEDKLKAINLVWLHESTAWLAEAKLKAAQNGFEVNDVSYNGFAYLKKDFSAFGDNYALDIKVYDPAKASTNYIDLLVENKRDTGNTWGIEKTFESQDIDILIQKASEWQSEIEKPLTDEDKAELLMQKSSDIENKLNIRSGSQLKSDQELQRNFILRMDAVIASNLKLGNSFSSKVRDIIEVENYHNLNSYLGFRGFYGQDVKKEYINNHIHNLFFGYENASLNPVNFNIDVPDSFEHIVDIEKYHSCLDPFKERKGKDYFKPNDEIIVESSLLKINAITPDYVIFKRANQFQQDEIIKYRFDMLKELFGKGLIRYSDYSSTDVLIFEDMLSEIKYCAIDSLKGVEKAISGKFKESLEKEHAKLLEKHIAIIADYELTKSTLNSKIAEEEAIASELARLEEEEEIAEAERLREESALIESQSLIQEYEDIISLYSDLAKDSKNKSIKQEYLDIVELYKDMLNDLK